MNTRRSLYVPLATAALGFALAPAPPADTCARTADAARRAAELQAEADYWIQLANCMNDADGGVGACTSEAAADLRQALEEIEAQDEARLAYCALLGSGPYDPQLEPDELSPDVDNPWLPLVPGRTLFYAKVTPEGVERVSVETLDETLEIDGVECRAVRDVVWIGGELVEDTTDWFAQHEDGAVWYMGEIARNYEDGLLEDLDGSWRAGKDDAKAGVSMPAAPAPGDIYRQEFLVGEAEDIARVVSVGETVTVAYGTFTDCVQTEDTTPLEPDALERKFYAPGIGLVLEVDLETGERLELVDVR